jgi:hypothetical protein
MKTYLPTISNLIVLGILIYILFQLNSINKQIDSFGTTLTSSYNESSVLNAKYDSLVAETKIKEKIIAKANREYDSVLTLQKNTITKGQVAVSSKKEAIKRKDTAAALISCDTLASAFEKLVEETWIKDSLANVVITGHEQKEKDMRVMIDVKEIDNGRLKDQLTEMRNNAKVLWDEIEKGDKALKKKSGWNGFWKGLGLAELIIILTLILGGG